MRARGRRVALGAVLGLAGLGLGALGSSAQATTPSLDGISCTTWTTPTPDVPPVQVSALNDGVPYVLVCTDQDGHQTTSVFVYSTAH